MGTNTPPDGMERRISSEALEQAVERAMVLAFAPLHKRVFGIAIGTACATFIAVATVMSIFLDPRDGVGIGILRAYFRGYSLSPAGVVIGAAWAFAVGFVGGWFLAFWRNFFLATWLLYIRVRANLMQTREFLDHI
jgi:hypothetical protein